jgi:hypothetical protein
MSYVSWQDQTFAQGGEGGALEWLLQQIRPEGGEWIRTRQKGYRAAGEGLLMFLAFCTCRQDPRVRRLDHHSDDLYLSMC